MIGATNTRIVFSATLYRTSIMHRVITTPAKVVKSNVASSPIVLYRDRIQLPWLEITWVRDGGTSTAWVCSLDFWLK